MFMVKSFLRMFPGMSAAIANDNPNVTVMDGARNVSSDVTATAVTVVAAAEQVATAAAATTAAAIAGRTYLTVKRKGDVKMVDPINAKLSAAAEDSDDLLGDAAERAAGAAAEQPAVVAFFTAPAAPQSDEEKLDRLRQEVRASRPKRKAEDDVPVVAEGENENSPKRLRI